MKKTLLLSSQPIAKNNHSAFVRIAQFIEKNLDNIYLVDFETLTRFREEVDNIVVAYGTFYADFKKMMQFLEVNQDKRFFYMINEYGLVPNGDVYRFLIKHDYGVIANYVESSQGAKHFTNFHTVNMNTSALKDIENIPFKERDKKLIYWGRFRTDRKKYFEKYLHNCDVSTAQKNMKHFHNLDQNLQLMKPVDFNLSSQLNRYRFSLYIEDVYTHTHYNHLADRFYEALSFGLIMFFDNNVKNTVKQSGYMIDDFYFVSSYEELNEKMIKVEENPQLHIEFFHNLKTQAILEQKTTIKSLKEIFDSSQELPPETCSNCNSKSYKTYNCSSCSTPVCTKCMEIHKKFFCHNCYSKLDLKKDVQTQLF